MINAYFNYNPVGSSLFVIQENDKEVKETTVSTEDNATMIEFVCGAMAGAGVEHLYCNAPAMSLAAAIKQYLLTEYNNNTLIIEQYKE